MIRYFIFLTLLLALGFTVTHRSDDAAMAQCQKTHSYDVCFQELNR